MKKEKPMKKGNTPDARPHLVPGGGFSVRIDPGDIDGVEFARIEDGVETRWKGRPGHWTPAEEGEPDEEPHNP